MNQTIKSYLSLQVRLEKKGEISRKATENRPVFEEENEEAEEASRGLAKLCTAEGCKSYTMRGGVCVKHRAK